MVDTNSVPDQQSMYNGGQYTLAFYNKCAMFMCQWPTLPLCGNVHLRKSSARFPEPFCLKQRPLMLNEKCSVHHDQPQYNFITNLRYIYMHVLHWGIVRGTLYVKVALDSIGIKQISFIIIHSLRFITSPIHFPCFAALLPKAKRCIRSSLCLFFQ